MYELFPKKLYIGHALQLRDARQLFDLEIVAVVDVAYEEPPAQLPREFIYCRVPLLDGGGNEPHSLRLAVEMVRQLLQSGSRTLIGCSAGMNRSPAIAAVALAAHLRVSPMSLLEKMGAVKPLEISPRFWTDLIAATNDLPPAESA